MSVLDSNRKVVQMHSRIRLPSRLEQQVLSISIYIEIRHYYYQLIMLLTRLSYLRKASLLSRVLHYFSSPVTLSKQVQQAVWAHLIMQKILRSAPSQSITPSLKDEILEIQVPATCFTFDPAHRKQVMALFEAGVPLNDFVYDQTRVSQATNEDTKLFTFYPNYLVTRKVFEVLADTSNKKYFIIGSSGISKTISIILYIELTRFIHRLYYYAYRNPALLKEMEHEQLKGLFRVQYPKYWYWTISVENLNVQNYLSKLIVEHEDHLVKEDLERLKACSSLKELRQVIKSMYQGNVRHKLVIDQINSLADLMRQSNQVCEDYLNRDILAQNERKQVEDRYKNNKDKFDAYGLMYLLRDFMTFSNSYVFNSSVNIQPELLKMDLENRYKIGLGLVGHTEYKMETIQFQQDLKTLWGKLDFWNFFWFEISRKLMQLNIQERKIAEIRALFLQKVTEIQDTSKEHLKSSKIQREKMIILKKARVKSYYSFFEIRKVISAWLSIFSNISALLNSKDMFNTLWEGIINNFDQFCFDQRKKVLKNYLSGNTRHGKNIVFTINSLALAELQKKSQLLQFDAQQLRALLGLDVNLKTIIQSQDHKQIIPFRLNYKGKKVAFIWTASEVAALTASILFPETYQSFAEYILMRQYEQTQNIPSLKGFHYEFVIGNALGPNSNANFIFYDQRLEKTNRKFRIQQKMQFIPFNKKSKTTHQYSDFSKVLEISKLHPLQSFSAIPIYLNSKGERIYAYNSHSIDFVIAEYYPQLNRHFIYAFDVNVAKSVQQKEAKMFELYDEISGKIGNKLEFNCVILSRAALAKKQRFVKTNFSIIYSSLEDLQINCPDHNISDLFELIHKGTLRTLQ